MPVTSVDPGVGSGAELGGVPVRVLAVCTANISRSPAVERLLQRGLGDTVGVRSAGVMALVGEPIDPPVAAFLQGSGVDASGFAARQVTEAHLKQSDLVLALTKAHRAHVLSLAPAAVRRTYTLLEFARVLSFVDLTGLPPAATAGERLRQVLPMVTAGRSLAPRAADGGDDVPDPYGHGEVAYARSLTLIREATATISRLLLPAGGAQR